MRRLLTVFFVLSFALLGTGIALAADHSDPCTDPRMAMGPCPTDGPVAPSASSSPTPSAAASSAAPSASAEASTTPEQVAPGQQRRGLDEEWGTSAAESASELSELAAERYARSADQGTARLLSTYSMSFGIGLVIFAVVMILMLARASRGGRSAEDRAAFLDALPRMLLYVPLMIAIPAMVSFVGGLTQAMGESLAQASGASFGVFMLDAAVAFRDVGILDLLGRAFLALILLIVYQLSMLLWLLEDLVAEYALWILTALIPIAAALSLWPSNRRMFWRIVGVVIGCALVPTVTRFGFWVMFQMIGDRLAQGMDLMAMLSVLVVIILSTSMPVIFAFVMPAILPQGAGASNGVAGNPRGHLWAAGHQVKDGVGRLTDQFKGAGQVPNGLPDRAVTGSAATARTGAATAGAAGGGAAAGSAGAAGAGGAGAGGAAAGAGPVGVGLLIAAGVAKSVGDATVGATRGSALRANAAAGGGYVTDPDKSSPGRGLAAVPARRGGGSGAEPAAAENAAAAADYAAESWDDADASGYSMWDHGVAVDEIDEPPAPQTVMAEPVEQPDPVAHPGPTFSWANRPAPPAPPAGVYRVPRRQPPVPATPPARRVVNGPPPPPKRLGGGRP